MKLSNWKIEYTITLFVIFSALLIIIPTSIKSTVQANFITKWKDNYNKLVYAQDAMLKQEQSQILTSLAKADTPEKKETLIITLMKPYFRINDKKPPKRYRVKYMNKTPVTPNSEYFISDYYYTENHIIVGIKDLPNYKDNTRFLMTFDVNGTLPPNIWGRDIYGVIVYGNKIEALGRELPIDKQKENCSYNSAGTACSNYYLIGGEFHD